MLLIWVILVSYNMQLYWVDWGYIGGILGTHWGYIGGIFEIYWGYIGDIFGIDWGYWGYIRDKLWIYWVSQYGYFIVLWGILGVYWGYIRESWGYILNIRETWTRGTSGKHQSPWSGPPPGGGPRLPIEA